MIDDYNIISIGDHCSIPSILRIFNLKKKTYPFDWVTNVDELNDTNIIYNVLNIINEFDNIPIKNITERYIGNAFTNNRLNKNNNIFFPHDSDNDPTNFEKYERRFERLSSDLKSKKSIFILLTRYYYINEETFNKIKTVLLKFNSDNKILFISGKDHPYFYNYSSEGFEKPTGGSKPRLSADDDNKVTFKNIFYDVSKFNGYDKDFSVEIIAYLKSYFNLFDNIG